MEPMGMPLSKKGENRTRSDSGLVVKLSCDATLRGGACNPEHSLKEIRQVLEVLRKISKESESAYSLWDDPFSRWSLSASGKTEFQRFFGVC